MRYCDKCKSDLPTDAFYQNKCATKWCKECWRRWTRAYRNSDAYRAQKRAYYAQNKEQYKTWNRNYDKTERGQDSRRSRKARRRQRHRASGVIVRYKEILRRDGYRCHLCHRRISKKTLSFDHLIPLSKGGLHVPENVAVAHIRCNQLRGDGRIPAQLLLGV